MNSLARNAKSLPKGSALTERAAVLAARLLLDSRDVVLDLGCGDGLIAARLADGALWMHCADAEPGAIDACRERLASFPNVEIHLIPYADLSALRGKGVSKAYSERLFTRGNFYDMSYYLQAAHGILNAGGLFAFSFHDGDVFRYDSKADGFNGEIAAHRRTRMTRIFECAHMISLATLRNIVPQLGFEIAAVWRGRDSLTDILLRKA
jgi:cyclopropane fatty-acyl-phospholipid synthase-like methyltransferase